MHLEWPAARCWIAPGAAKLRHHDQPADVLLCHLAQSGLRAKSPCGDGSCQSGQSPKSVVCIPDGGRSIAVLHGVLIDGGASKNRFWKAPFHIRGRCSCQAYGQSACSGQRELEKYGCARFFSRLGFLTSIFPFPRQSSNASTQYERKLPLYGHARSPLQPHHRQSCRRLSGETQGLSTLHRSSARILVLALRS